MKWNYTDTEVQYLETQSLPHSKLEVMYKGTFLTKSTKTALPAQTVKYFSSYLPFDFDGHMSCTATKMTLITKTAVRRACRTPN